MVWPYVVSLALGVICGVKLHVGPFALLAFAATLLFFVHGLADDVGVGAAFLRAGGACLCLQGGYASGLVFRGWFGQVKLGKAFASSEAKCKRKAPADT